jgi:class 3 adenylate cyclase
LFSWYDSHHIRLKGQHNKTESGCEWLTYHIMTSRPSGPFAFVFTDIKESSKLSAAYPQEMDAALIEHTAQVERLTRLSNGEIIPSAAAAALAASKTCSSATTAAIMELKTSPQALTQHDDFIMKTVGDAFVIKFDSLASAALFAFRLQSELLSPKTAIYIDRERGIGLHVRIGIDIGYAFQRTTTIQHGIEVLDFFGNTVNTASRMESKVSDVDGFAIGLTAGAEQIGLEQLVDFLELEQVSSAVRSLQDWQQLKTAFATPEEAANQGWPASVLFVYDTVRFVTVAPGTMPEEYKLSAAGGVPCPLTPTPSAISEITTTGTTTIVSSVSMPLAPVLGAASADAQVQTPTPSGFATAASYPMLNQQYQTLRTPSMCRNVDELKGVAPVYVVRFHPRSMWASL